VLVRARGLAVAGDQDDADRGAAVRRGDADGHAESDLVVFGGGIEADQLLLGWGQRLTIGVAAEVLNLL
jgi:hypothetical protein